MSSVPSMVRVAGLANVRDLGARMRADGSLTPRGVFLRSERLDLVDEAGWSALCALGVTTVIDLRRPSEVTGTVPPAFDHMRVDLDGADSEFWEPYIADGRWGTPLYYAAHLLRLPDRLAAALDAIAAAKPGAILFHCSAGWDRTGLVAAVLHRALDVTAPEATADYLTSFTNADAMRALHNRSFEAEERREVLRRFGHTPESAFAQAYDGIHLDSWFDAAGVAADTRTAIRTWRGTVRGEVANSPTP